MQGAVNGKGAASLALSRKARRQGKIDSAGGSVMHRALTVVAETEVFWKREWAVLMHTATVPSSCLCLSDERFEREQKLHSFGKCRSSEIDI